MSASPMQNATPPHARRTPLQANIGRECPPHARTRSLARRVAAGVPLAFRGGMATTRKRKSPTKGRSASTKYGEGARKSVKSAVERQKAGTLKAGAGRHPKAKNRKQAIAIGLSEARKKGAKVPRKSQ